MADFSRSTAYGWRQGDDASDQARVGFSGWYQVASAGAPTPPTGTVTISAVTPSDTTAQVTYSYDDTDETGFEYRLDGGTAASIGASPATITGLTTATTYDIEVRAINGDGEGAWSAPFEFTTTAPDTEDPVLTGSITIGQKTDTTIPFSFSAGTDNVGITAYDVRVDLGAWTEIGASPSGTLTGLTALTEYDIDVSARDAAGNRSNILSATTSTYRAGDTAANIIANTAPIGDGEPGFLYALALTKDPDDWLSWYEVTPPDPSGGTLDANPDGSFTYNGPSPATWVIQAETNGVEEAETTTVTLYDQPEGADETEPTLSNPVAAAVGSAASNGSIDTDEANGTLYWVTNTSASAVAATVLAGSSQAVTAIGTQNTYSSGLTEETGYYTHWLHKDAAGNESAVVSSDQFTTGAAPAPSGLVNSRLSLGPSLSL